MITLKLITKKIKCLAIYDHHALGECQDRKGPKWT